MKLDFIYRILIHSGIVKNFHKVFWFRSTFNNRVLSFKIFGTVFFLLGYGTRSYHSIRIFLTNGSPLRKIPNFHLISPETLQKLRLSIKFLHQEISWIRYFTHCQLMRCFLKFCSTCWEASKYVAKAFIGKSSEKNASLKISQNSQGNTCVKVFF